MAVGSGTLAYAPPIVVSVPAVNVSGVAGAISAEQMMQLSMMQSGGGSGYSSGGGGGGNNPTTNWKSVKKYGHTFSRHGSGQKVTKSLLDRARSTGNNQGQWLDNQGAAEFLDSLGDIKEPITVSIPEGLGQVITPTGEIIPATKAIVVPSATGIKTAYPIL